MHVAPPSGVGADRAAAFANGRRVASHSEDGLVVFDLPARAGKPVAWAVTR